MFKTFSSENEIYKNMESKLVQSQVEKQHGFDKLAKATELLNKAAIIFENAKMYAEAEEITNVISALIQGSK
jgi:hypothetical protein